MVKLVMQFIMADTHSKNKLQMYIRFRFAGYKLQNLSNCGISKNTQASTNKAPTKEQKDAICKYIGRLDKINMYAHPQMIVEDVNYLIYFKNCVVGYQFLKQFLEQNPKYHIRTKAKIFCIGVKVYLLVCMI